MAVTHQSGFSGSITWNAGAGPGPLTLVSSTTLQKWAVAQETSVIEAYAKGDTWKTKFPTVNRWSADVEALVPDGQTPATELIVGQTITIFWNGSQVWTYTDNSAGKLTTGNPGIGAFYRPGATQSAFGWQSVVVTAL